MRRLLAGVIVLAALLALPAVAPAANGPKTKDNDLHLQLLAINDLHGHLEPTTPGTIQIGCCNPVIDRNTGLQTGWTQKTVPAGGIAFLATHIKDLRATNPNTITVGAGDLIGASPLVSALFHDEPTIEALNTIHFDVAGVGNHEFDEGVDELLRMQFGNQLGGDGCSPVDGCQDGTPFEGAFFHYLAANVFYKATQQTIFPPYEVRKIGNAKIAFIGLTLEGTPTIVTPSAVEGLDFKPEIATVNALVDQLRDEQGVKAFVVLLHQGGTQRPPAPPKFPGTAPVGNEYTKINECENFLGPEIQSIAEGIDSRVKVIVSAHTHQPYICHFGGKLVTSAASFGRLVTKIDLTIDHQSKQITDATAENKIVTQTVTPDADAKAILDKYSVLSAPLANKLIGTITGDILSPRDVSSAQNAAGDQPMGDVIADAMLERTAPVDVGGAVAAFMNSGGVRGSLFFAKSPPATGETVDGQVRYTEAFTVQPFGNTLVVKTCTGQQIYDVLNQQYNNPEAGANRIMLVSANVDYHWTSTPTPHVVDGTVSFDDGATFISKSSTYRVVMNNFMADGGDGYTVFRSCTDALGGDVDLDAFAAYLGKHPNLAPPVLDRIHRDG